MTSLTHDPWLGMAMSVLVLGQLLIVDNRVIEIYVFDGKVRGAVRFDSPRGVDRIVYYSPLIYTQRRAFQ